MMGFATWLPTLMLRVFGDQQGGGGMSGSAMRRRSRVWLHSGHSQVLVSVVREALHG